MQQDRRKTLRIHNCCGRPALRFMKRRLVYHYRRMSRQLFIKRLEGANKRGRL
jgi:hypothetical protein